MSKFLPIGNRLKEERERLGFNQADFAALGEVGRKTQYNYESGERAPDGAYLAAIALAGADVLYIITGTRGLSGAAPGPESAESASPMARKKSKIKRMVDEIDSEKGLEAVQAELQRVAEVKGLKRRVAELEKRAG